MQRIKRIKNICICGARTDPWGTLPYLILIWHSCKSLFTSWMYISPSCHVHSTALSISRNSNPVDFCWGNPFRSNFRYAQELLFSRMSYFESELFRSKYLSEIRFFFYCGYQYSFNNLTDRQQYISQPVINTFLILALIIISWISFSVVGLRGSMFSCIPFSRRDGVFSLHFQFGHHLISFATIKFHNSAFWSAQRRDCCALLKFFCIFHLLWSLTSSCLSSVRFLGQSAAVCNI